MGSFKETDRCTCVELGFLALGMGLTGLDGFLGCAGGEEEGVGEEDRGGGGVGVSGEVGTPFAMGDKFKCSGVSPLGDCSE